ncbi:hypothetical protein MASR1M97_19560 [Candidatus Desulfobacillus denitrificans]
MAVEMHVRLRQRQRLAGGDAQLQVDEVEAGDELRHRVLDLQTRVHLHEDEIAFGQQEFDGAGADVADRLRRPHRRLAHAGAEFGADCRRGRLLDDFLVAALDGTVALAEMDDVALRVGEDLDLDVARRRQRVFEDQLARAEGRLRLGARRGERRRQVGEVRDAAHAAPAAAGRRLDHQRQADLLRLPDQRGVGLVGAVVAGNAGHAGLAHAALGLGLVAHQADRLGRRADEDEAGLRAGLGEGGVLGEEAVAGMHGLGAGGLGGGDDPLDVEVGLARRRGADLDGFVGEARMQGVAVGGRDDGHRAQPARAAAADDAAGDLAAVGYKDFSEHQRTSFDTESTEKNCMHVYMFSSVISVPLCPLC